MGELPGERESFAELCHPAEVGDALLLLALLLAPLLVPFAWHLGGQWGWVCAALLGVLAGGGAVQHLARPVGARLSLECGPDGLTERRWRAPDRHWDWDQVRGVDEHPLGATIHTTHGDLELGATLADRLRLLRRVRAALGVAAVRDTDGSVARATVADWAGIETHETLAVTIPPRLERFRHAFWMGGLLATVAVGIGYAGTLLPLALAGGYLAAVHVLTRGLGTARVIKVSPDGLAIRAEGWFCSWDEVAAVEPEEDGYRIVTEQGDFVLGYRRPDEQTLVHLLQRAVAHRDEGLALPRMGEVSDAAISRAGENERLPETGLSRAERW